MKKITSLCLHCLQVKNVLAPSPADPKKTWAQCKLDIKSCSPSQLTTLQS